MNASEWNRKSLPGADTSERLLGEDGNYYAVSTLKLTNEDFSELESEKTNITIEYIIEDEGSQLTLLKIIEKN